MSRGWLAFVWAIIGGVVGQLGGVALATQVPFLNTSLPEALKLGPTTLDLAFLVVSFGFQLKLTLGGAIGIGLALWLALRHG